MSPVKKKLIIINNNPFNGPLYMLTQVSQYLKKNSLTHTRPLSLLYNIFN